MKAAVKRKWKKIMLVPAFLVFFVVAELWLGCGYDAWDGMAKWSRK